TPDPQIRSLVLYPAELRVQANEPQSMDCWSQADGLIIEPGKSKCFQQAFFFDLRGNQRQDQKLPVGE
ncbi:MAG: hypothetical protein AAFN43_01810, partial [Pseudomonadota bacterium]